MRRTDEDIEVMRRALATMQESPYGSVKWRKRDVAFHGAVAAATRNVYMSQFLTFVSERVGESILAAGSRSGSDDMARITLDEHTRILDAIEAGDPARAQRAMRDHLTGSAKRVGLAIENGGQR